MNLLVIINSKGQDLVLGVEIDRVMKLHHWKAVDGFDFTYTKKVENEDIDDLAIGIENDIDAAADQAEWDNVKYLYKIGGGAVVVG